MTFVILTNKLIKQVTTMSSRAGPNTGAAAEFEDYHTVSSSYDNWRRPIGLESLERALDAAAKGIGKETKALKLLDVGCGTGNYIEWLKEKVGSCTGLEFNPGMLSEAIAKHKGDDRVKLFQGSAVNMDEKLEPESFDIVIITQVLHHLTLEMQNKAIQNIQKVLKKKGT